MPMLTIRFGLNLPATQIDQVNGEEPILQRTSDSNKSLNRIEVII